MSPVRFIIQVLAAAASFAMIAAAPARAGMIGSTVTSQYYVFGATYGSTATFTADGQAHPSSYPLFNITVTDTQVIYQFTSAGSWTTSPTSLDSNGLYISNGNLLSFTGPAILSAKIDPATTMAGFTASNLTFNGGAIAVSWGGLAFNSSTKVVLDVATVDEPRASALLALGVGGFALSRRPWRRRKLG